MTFDLNAYRENAAKQGYMEVPFAVSPETIALAVERFFAFLALPTEQKVPFGWEMKLTEDERGADLGYHLRTSADGQGHDNKEFFHYNPEAHKLLAKDPAIPKELAAFLESAEHVYQGVHQTLTPVAEALGKAYPPEMDLTGYSSVLRFLKYDMGEPGKFLARGHYDRNISSLAIAESAPGLRIGPNPEHLQEVAHRPGYALLFPSLMLEEQSHGDIHASWHDVVQKPEAALSANTARWAVVYFACPNKPSYLFRDVTHTKRT